MPIRSLILACGVLLVISLGMALRSLPGPSGQVPEGRPQTVVRPVVYVETGTLATAVAWRALVRAELRRVGGSMS